MEKWESQGTAMNNNKADNFVRKILILNGIGDILVGIILILDPGILSNLINISLNLEGIYLSGGWGIAALAFGFLRLFAGLHSNREISWFTAIFGLVEGTVLTIYGIFLATTTELSFSQISLSTTFGLIFAVAYGIVFILRGKKSRY
jgi:hypothetical protein